MNYKLVNTAAMLLMSVIVTVPVPGANAAETSVPTDKTQTAVAGPDRQTTAAARYTPVLERFRTYAGPRTPAALVALFAAPVTAAVHQQPEVALSDGASLVKLTIEAASPEGKAPNVALNAAQLMALTHVKAKKWAIEALPAAGTWSASLILLTDSGSREVPLTVAPRLPAGTDLSEKGFVAFLGGAKTAGRPLLDVNEDGRRDYLDDYIFTANYLVGSVTTADIAATGQSATTHDPGATPKSDSQAGESKSSSDEQHGAVSSQNSRQQESASGQGAYSQGSYAAPAAAPIQSPSGAAGTAPMTMAPTPQPPTTSVPATLATQAPLASPATPALPSTSAVTGAPAASATTTAPEASLIPSEPTTTPVAPAAPAPEIKLDTSPDRHNTVNRNERARKIKELLHPPAAN